jgi:hypothetical protein
MTAAIQAATNARRVRSGHQWRGAPSEPEYPRAQRPPRRLRESVRRELAVPGSGLITEEDHLAAIAALETQHAADLRTLRLQVEDLTRHNQDLVDEVARLFGLVFGEGVDPLAVLSSGSL